MQLSNGNPKFRCTLFDVPPGEILDNPGTAEVGAISKAQNCKKGTLWALFVGCNSSWLQNMKKIKWDPWEILKYFRRKLNKIFEKCRRGTLCFRGSGRQCFCFGRGSGVSSMFWTAVIQIDVEQMNTKVDRSIELTKKTSHCKSRAFSSKTPTKKIHFATEESSFLQFRKVNIVR